MNKLEDKNRRIDQYIQELIPRHKPHKSGNFNKGDEGDKGRGTELKTHPRKDCYILKCQYLKLSTTKTPKNEEKIAGRRDLQCI